MREHTTVLNTPGVTAITGGVYAYINIIYLYYWLIYDLGREYIQLIEIIIVKLNEYFVYLETKRNIV